MAPNKTLIYKQVPNGLPVPGQDLVIEDRPIDLDAAPPQGHLLVQILDVSLDPYLRGKMRPPGAQSYSAAFEPGQPIPNSAIAKVLKSSAEGFAEGDLVKTFPPIAEYAVVPGSAPATRKIANPHGLDLGYFLGALGMPGLTAYASLYKIGKPQKGETIFVSSAAGAVGQIVGQLAKHEGLKVIGSVGSDEKLEFITKELGFDSGFNYKKETPADALARLAPDGIDIYYENVGGEHLDAALKKMNTHGKIIVCGLASQYNVKPGEGYAVKNFSDILTRRLTVQGFIVGDPGFADAYVQEHQEKVQQWLADGTFKAKLSVTEGIDHAAEALVGMLEGKNFGKAIVRVSKA